MSIGERKLAELYEQVGPADGGTRFFVTQVRSVARERRLAMIERPRPAFAPTPVRALGSKPRRTLLPPGESQRLPAGTDGAASTANTCARHFTVRAAWRRGLETQGHMVNRKRVRRLMQRMGLAAIYQRPRTSRPAPEHRIYPYLLRGLVIERINQVWAADITAISRWRAAFSTWSR